jgi:hypothetical protein
MTFVTLTYINPYLCKKKKKKKNLTYLKFTESSNIGIRNTRCSNHNSPRRWDAASSQFSYVLCSVNIFCDTVVNMHLKKGELSRITSIFFLCVCTVRYDELWANPKLKNQLTIRVVECTAYISQEPPVF